jgi:ferredoxin
MDIIGPHWMWLFGVLGITAVVLLPNFVKSKDHQAASVRADKCVGCKLCSVDCPYEAIYMSPRNDGSKFKEIAVVIDDRCAECGLCVGACNFDAIELPYNTSPVVMDDIRIALQEA